MYAWVPPNSLNRPSNLFVISLFYSTDFYCTLKISSEIENPALYYGPVFIPVLACADIFTLAK